MEVSIYHKLLRVSMVTVALVLIFDGGYLSPITKQLSDNAMSYVANSVTGISAQVPENDLNRVTTELSEWERSLSEREADLANREIAARDFDTSGSADYSTFILSTILFILTALIGLNYALDFARARRPRHEHAPA